jgi:hypothetical protein
MRRWVLSVAVLVVAGCGGTDAPPPGTEGSSSTGQGDSGSGSADGGNGDSGSSGTPNGDAGSGAPDVAPLDTGLMTACGKPGDMGNSQGVGKYCNGFADCAGNGQAILCATLGDPNAHFCTFACMSAASTACGAGASCQCLGGQCGCVPDTCK